MLRQHLNLSLLVLLFGVCMSTPAMSDSAAGLGAGNLVADSSASTPNYDGLYVGTYMSTVSRCNQDGTKAIFRIVNNAIQLIGPGNRSVPVDGEGNYNGSFEGWHQGLPSDPNVTITISGRVSGGILSGRKIIIPPGSGLVCPYTYVAPRVGGADAKVGVR
jgi:hypothetical protein